MPDTTDLPEKLVKEEKAIDERTSVAQQVKLLAKSVGMTITEVAAKLGVDRRAMNYWCSGEKLPNDNHYFKLQEILSGLEVELRKPLRTGKPLQEPEKTEKTRFAPVLSAEPEPRPPESCEKPAPTPPPKILSIAYSNNNEDDLLKYLSGEGVSELGVCGKCPLASKVESLYVTSEVAYPSEIMLLGMCPGMTELKEGAPFVGKAGQYLNELLEIANIKRSSCYITNAVKSR